VQFTRARSQLASRVCLDAVLSRCVYPLDPSTSKCEYTWLLQGNSRELRRVVGFTGLCSELIYCFAKITHLSARRLKHPSSDVIPLVGREIGNQLTNFWQWSELSDGFGKSEELLESCELDEGGKVTTQAKVTELVAESYAATAQLYLECRLFRLVSLAASPSALLRPPFLLTTSIFPSRRRKDPIVQTFLRRLLRAIEYRPTTGPLLTAQTPLFAVFIGGIVAYRPEDRDVICAWFNPICECSRGNVPPAYAALKHMWAWLDNRGRNRSD
jgi:hypothetical protein